MNSQSSINIPLLIYEAKKKEYFCVMEFISKKRILILIQGTNTFNPKTLQENLV